MSDYLGTYTESHALLVGVNDYAHPTFQPLGNAQQDAADLADLLAGEPYHFQTRLLLGDDATKQNILDALFNLRDVEENSRVIFYFAGHGYTIPDRFGHEIGYLACTDTIPQRDYTALNLDEAMDLRRFSAAKHIAFIFDSCFSGKALGMTTLRSTADRFIERRAYQVLSAGAGDQAVSDRRSMTRLLLQALDPAKATDLLRLNGVGLFVQDQMARDTKSTQIPQFGHIEGSQGGDMVFYEPPEAQPIDLLPERLRRGLTHEDADMRFFAIERAEKLLNDAKHGASVRAVLEDMQYDDPNRDVRRRAGEALRSAPPERLAIEVSTGEPEPEPVRDPILDILPPPFEWCEIPGVQGFGLVTDEGYQGTYDISPFFMAKYLITYEQFQVFIDAEDGFYNDEWWRGLAKCESQPGKQEFTHAENLPRDTVSWYQAVAFCRWLSNRVGYEVRLPTEWEWQWAAQGPDRRAYPWGNAYIKGHANIDEKGSGIIGGAYLEKTTPVGSYPKGASPYGVLDMSGNVSECCLNEYPDTGKTDTSGDANRIDRGGSWQENTSTVRTDYRIVSPPGNKGWDAGFRVVGFVPIPG
jgi:formylglycine-generating enzyme required for sulfatase activity